MQAVWIMVVMVLVVVMTKMIRRIRNMGKGRGFGTINKLTIGW